MCDRELPPPPTGEDVGTLVSRVARGSARMVPVVGGLLAEATDVLVSPLRRRQAEWLEALWRAVRELQERSVLPADETLAANEAFVSAAVHATRIAATTHQREKMEALRNAVLNVAAGTAPDDDQQAMFLDAVEALTASHVALLSRLRERYEYGRLLQRQFRPSQAGVWDTGGALRPGPISDSQLAQIIRDLRNRGFVEMHLALDQLDPATVPSADVALTDYGAQFLSFMTSPLEKSGHDTP